MRQRRACLAPYTRPDGVPRAPASDAHAAASSWDASAVAAALHVKHFCVLEGFASLAPGEMRRLLEQMHGAGELKPGEVSAGSHQRARGDVMQWLGSGACDRPPLSRLLASLDTLIEGLCLEPLLTTDLRDVLLVRHEVQATCYPGGGARYVKARGQPLRTVARSGRRPTRTSLRSGHSDALRSHPAPAVCAARGRRARPPREGPHLHLLLQPRLGCRQRRSAAAAPGGRRR